VLSGSTWCCPFAPVRRICQRWSTSTGILNVFENDLVELDAAATLAAAEANEHTLITAEVQRLHIAAHWADLHPGEAVPKAGCPAPNTQASSAGKAPPPSETSPPPNSAVCSASPTDQQPGSSVMPWICGTGCR
jgi:hypothetical protein